MKFKSLFVSVALYIGALVALSYADDLAKTKSFVAGDLTDDTLIEIPTNAASVTALSENRDAIKSVSNDVVQINDDLANLSISLESLGDRANRTYAAVNSLSNTVLTWSRYWSGDDFVVTITNYPTVLGANRSDSGKIPHLYMSWKTKDADSNDVMNIVWDERWWQDDFKTNYLANTYYNKTETKELLKEKAPKAWGTIDPMTGDEQIDGVISLSAPTILVSGGLTYQKTISTACTYFVLTDNGSGTILGDGENGYFRISDSDGVGCLEIVKGDKRLVGCVPESVHLDDAQTSLVVVYNVNTSNGNPPKCEASLDLANDTFKSEQDEACGSTVQWTGANWNWTATITPKQATTQLFARAFVEVGGETIIRNLVPVQIPKIVIGGIYYNLTNATISGKNVLVLER